jgi:hypothetical protein
MPVLVGWVWITAAEPDLSNQAEYFRSQLRIT